ncbi:hypothetical protein [Puia dinghuensis]|uniref:Cytochrome c domain-containing protein n=1 Tax=Puia dinghuensis TaxID=1792502 RepID=A0A8J2UDZ6_9BACT|nr:hypothetical protein [Puia dinghuensis]GGB03293.1 hypothetical protein GCM10011511_28200 [Puia dinghuensis]
MKWKLIFALAFAIIGISAIKNDDPLLMPRLSAYHLDADAEFIKYEVATPLFSDYAEKERLIKLPKGSTLTVTGDGLPVFPDGAILVKTFFYWRDKRDTTRGKQLIETRLLIRSAGGWQAGTYVWNKEQNEAFLTNTGQKADISWIDATGSSRIIHYRVPTSSQCATCHKSNDGIIPIGFKIRNLNIPVTRNGRSVNQLTWFAERGILHPINPSSYPTLPAWNDTAQPTEQRARAWLDVNCAHCHNESGFCSKSDFRPAYENTLSQTHIPDKKKRILSFLRSGRMPLLGTTVVHKEGLELIENYLNKK